MLGTSRVVATVLASVLLASPALAQPTAPPTDAEKQKAGDLVKQAITKSQAGDHQAAVDLYLKAYNIVPLAVLLSNVGTELQQAGKRVEALKYFCMYLEKDPTGTNASYATSQAKVLEVQLGTKVDDDRKVCEKPEPAPPPPPPQVPAGGNEPMGPTGTSGAVVKASTESDDPGKGLKLTGLVVSGVGVVGLGLGVYFGLQAKKISDDITNHTNTMVAWRPDIKAYEAKGQHDENLQIAFMIGGGVVLGGGIALYLLGRAKKSSTSEQISVAPMPLKSGGGLVLSGGF